MKTLQLLTLVVLQCSADVNTLDLTYKNNFENNQVEDSRITQGSVIIHNALMDNTLLTVQNSITHTKIDGFSIVKQSNINLLDESTLTQSNVHLVSNITQSTIDRGSLILQNNIIMKDSHMNASSIQSNSQIKHSNIQNSILSQSFIHLENDSYINNGSSFISHNLINNTKIENAILSQSELRINNSTLNNVQITSNHRIGSNQGRVELDNAIVIQGLQDIVQSNLSNSQLRTHTSISNTSIKDAVLNLCSNHIYNSRISHLNLQKNCSMEESRISNGAIFYQGMTRFN